MGQITTGIRALLNDPSIYVASQYLFGRGKGTPALVKDFVRPRSGDKVLDIGCGPAEIMDYLPGVSYWGFDPDPVYINRAKRAYGNAGHFFCKELSGEDLNKLPAFDVVLAIGVLHHLDDKTAGELLVLVHQALKPGGRLITSDPCFEAGQNPIARCFISWDRGQNVRTKEGYLKLVFGIFPRHRFEVRHQAWLPYTFCFMECIRV